MMIMDGLDTLSQVALADQQLNLSFDLTPAGTQGGAHPGSARFAGLDVPYDALDTPLTNAGDINFNFTNSEMELAEALPITATIEAAVTIPERISGYDGGFHATSLPQSSQAGGLTHRISYRGTFTTSATPTTSAATGCSSSSASGIAPFFSPLLSILTQGNVNPAQLAQSGELTVITDPADLFGAEDQAQGPPTPEVAEQQKQASGEISNPGSEAPTPQPQQPDTPFSCGSSSQPATPQQAFERQPSTPQQAFDRQQSVASVASVASVESQQCQSPEPMQFSSGYSVGMTTSGSTHSTPEPPQYAQSVGSPAGSCSYSPPPPPYSSAAMMPNFPMKEPPTYTSCSGQDQQQQAGLTFPPTSTEHQQLLNVPAMSQATVAVQEEMTYSKSFGTSFNPPIPDFQALQVPAVSIAEFSPQIIKTEPGLSGFKPSQFRAE